MNPSELMIPGSMQACSAADAANLKLAGRWWLNAYQAARGLPAEASLADCVRQAVGLTDLWMLPEGIKFVDPAIDRAPAWIFALPVKLESPNATMGRRWFVKNRQRAAFESMLWAAVAKVERVASRGALEQLGRAPACTIPMKVQIVRLVPSSREFIRDAVDNLAFAPKHLHDALVRAKLLASDRTAWLSGAPIVQAVSPTGRPVTVAILWPVAAAALPLGPERTADVCKPSSLDAPGVRRALPGDDRPGRTRARGRRRPDARTADPGPRQGN